MTAAGDRGTTRVSARAVRSIAALAAAEALPAGSTAHRTTTTSRGDRTQPHIDVRLHHPDSLADTVATLREFVARRTHDLTGLPCAPPDIRVTELTLPPPRTPARSSGASGASGASEAAAPPPRPPRRVWSQRRVPVAVLSLSSSLALGTLAFDIAGRWFPALPETAWWTPLVTWSTQSTSVTLLPVLGAGAALASGVLLILLAVLPGHRRRWTVSSAPSLTASVDRTVLEAVLRAAVGAVNGIGPVAVRVSRRTVTVRATRTRGDGEAALAGARDAAERALTACRLARPPRLRVVIGTTTSEPPVPGRQASPGPVAPSSGSGPHPGPVRRTGDGSARFGAPRTAQDDTPSRTIREGVDS
ncbi:DUF6286 domain-containing protein [Streptomyces sp. NBC_00691]|uniref:DUF6286 domain-containing protein n=1 Tax=Streptomyces sp. NBC_00691 TaxID=2903671 RepID=UPI003FA74A59